ncbi:neuroglobin-like [Pollicipes pollicipes]|uniref:neuroglobin-like n=1 Tax=Pollicipes pollicipes TaxID=41117 RepID=UPI001885A3B7|nr:neuroglobin-like [Pollicipes pollicipes]
MGASHAKERLEAAADEPAGKRTPQKVTGSRQGSLKARLCRAGAPPTPTEPPRLTAEDKQYLRETWSTLEADPTTVGIITFSQLFEANPSMKDVFETFRKIEVEDVKTSQELKQHAARVMGFVNKVISRLDSEDKYGCLMTELGCRHLSYGAKPEYIDMMGQQFIMVIRPSLVEANQWGDGAEQAWLKLFQVISYSMKLGLRDSQTAMQESSPRRSMKLPSLRRKSTPHAQEVTTHTIEY